LAEEHLKKKKRKGAVALRYDDDRDQAPKVAAKGWGEVAEKILAIAREHDIPLYEDPDLLEVLSKLDITEEIPPELYQAVAEVLSFIYRMNREWAED